MKTASTALASAMKTLSTRSSESCLLQLAAHVCLEHGFSRGHADLVRTLKITLAALDEIERIYDII